eukprot:915066-Pyramimonas_sp.AAC.1
MVCRPSRGQMLVCTIPGPEAATTRDGGGGRSEGGGDVAPRRSRLVQSRVLEGRQATRKLCTISFP